MDRRMILSAMLATAAAPGRLIAASPDPLQARFAALEASVRGRLGVAMLDLGTGRRFGYRADEPVRLCSTFKMLAAAFILYRADRGLDRLDRRIRYAKGDLPPYSPMTERNIANGMTLGELCEASITLSDNGAANLMLASFGGPPALTAFLRRTGDVVTRLDRTEPSLNTGAPDDPRDTSSPAAMIATMQRLLLDDVLSAPSRARLVGWMVAATTGRTKLRAGTPAGWIVGDKTGSAGDQNGGISNDIAILWPPGRRPLLIAAFLRAPVQDDERSSVIANVARILTEPA